MAVANRRHDAAASRPQHPRNRVEHGALVVGQDAFRTLRSGIGLAHPAQRAFRLAQPHDNAEMSFAFPKLRGRSAAEAGFNAHLVKPVDLNVLRKYLQEVRKRAQPGN